MNSAQKAYDEIVDLFARGTPSADILAFRPSRQAQQRVRYLLARKKADEITASESAELERFGELEHLMQLVKARAHLYAEGRK
jgi:hypothetical protein